MEGREDQIEKAIEITLDTVEERAYFRDPTTHPGVVFLRGEVPPSLNQFSRTVIQDVAQKRDALKLIGKSHAEAVGYKKGRGVIGALAAVGATMERCDHTYEFLAYRMPKNVGSPREIDAGSVGTMDRRTQPQTFGNIDYETGRILISPRGHDPVLYGIRGESPEVVLRAHAMVRANETMERGVVFRTNQGTDAHFPGPCLISEIRPHRPVVFVGSVSNIPRAIPGGHVIFRARDGSGEVDCAAYEPTGRFRDAVKRLRPGDLVKVYGGTRPPSGIIQSPTVNLEKLEILRIADCVEIHNPLCPRCGKRMTSMGRGGGFECRRCGFRSRALRRVETRGSRGVRPGLYVPPPRAQRHLTKPISRYGMEKTTPPPYLIEGWHVP